jgi:hypothetical protein
MAYEQKDNSGSIFRNDKKEKETHPDGKGSAMIDGVEYWVSSWNKVGQNGTQFRSLAFQRKEGVPSQQRQQPEPARRPSQDAARARQLAPRGGFDDIDSDLPPF